MPSSRFGPTRVLEAVLMRTLETQHDWSETWGTVAYSALPPGMRVQEVLSGR
ncbi:MAG: hypothetical protein MPW14_25960 (plasmid) [Candidatus Manganitrophus sp.]|nr:MAG: hypothetical protein MPW14_25960 [Candidatus Manganitrophus sp.]